MSLYLLDTNIYINFYDRFYRFEHFPGFWNVFKDILNEFVILPNVVLDEINKSPEFHNWLNNNLKSVNSVVINHKTYAEQWADVIQYIAEHPCYSEKALTDANSWTRERVADGWLIAMAKKEGYTIVTDELSNPNLNAHHPSSSVKIPDIAKDFNIQCISMNTFFKKIGFKL